MKNIGKQSLVLEVSNGPKRSQDDLFDFLREKTLPVHTSSTFAMLPAFMPPSKTRAIALLAPWSVASAMSLLCHASTTGFSRLTVIGWNFELHEWCLLFNFADWKGFRRNLMLSVKKINWWVLINRYVFRVDQLVKERQTVVGKVSFTVFLFAGGVNVLEILAWWLHWSEYFWQL